MVESLTSIQQTVSLCTESLLSYLGLVGFRPRHDPAQNTHFLRHQQRVSLTSSLIRVLAPPAPQLSVQVFEKVSVVLFSDEEGGYEETEYEADT